MHFLEVLCEAVDVDLDPYWLGVERDTFVVDHNRLPGLLLLQRDSLQVGEGVAVLRDGARPLM